MVVVVVSTALQVAGPALIAIGIDQGLPALDGENDLDADRASSSPPTCCAGIVGAVLIAQYTLLAARISQACCSTCAGGSIGTPSG